MTSEGRCRMIAVRKIIRIDEGKCNGCGQCVPACHEGALQIVDGKARLVSEVYCDGLGNCLGECPQGAIRIEEREAEEFDPEATVRHLEAEGRPVPQELVAAVAPAPAASACPGSLARALRTAETAPAAAGAAPEVRTSRLGNWPVQLTLLPVQAPYYDGAKLLISADCVPFALPDFHERFLGGRTLAIGCPKLDEAEVYRHKLAEILRRNDIESVEVLHMEVPCCFGLVHLVGQALADSGKPVPASATRIGLEGDVQETTELERG